MDISSKRVYEETYSYMSIAVPVTDNPREEYDDAYSELNVFRKDWYGENVADDVSPIEEHIDEYGMFTLRFATTYTMIGRDLNLQVYPSAIDARSLM
jgi:hypothetical protein